jgi:hypothetical protein
MTVPLVETTEEPGTLDSATPAIPAPVTPETVLVLDFGSQYSQSIASLSPARSLSSRSGSETRAA